jgi:hypothetical protein
MEWGAAPAGSASSAEPPGALGDIARPNYVGPSGNGLVERMKAGESPPNQGRRRGAPVRLQKAVLRPKERAAARRREARRSASWTGSSLPPEGPARPQGGPRGAAFRTSAFRRFAPSRLEGAKVQGAPGAGHPGRRSRVQNAAIPCRIGTSPVDNLTFIIVGAKRRPGGESGRR